MLSAFSAFPACQRVEPRRLKHAPNCVHNAQAAGLKSGPRADAEVFSFCRKSVSWMQASLAVSPTDEIVGDSCSHVSKTADSAWHSFMGYSLSWAVRKAFFCTS